MKRRQTFQLILANSLGLLAAPLLHAQPLPGIAALLRAGGCAVMLRHAQTEAGVGDPPGFQIDICSTQRNLSSQGRAQAAAIGRWFSSRSLVPSSVQSSQWCRCMDTAELAFGSFGVLAALGSTFEERSNQEAQTRSLQTRLAAISPGTFEVWVTHQVNVSAFSGAGPSMGEGFVIQTTAADGTVKILARSRFE